LGVVEHHLKTASLVLAGILIVYLIFRYRKGLKYR